MSKLVVGKAGLPPLVEEHPPPNPVCAPYVNDSSNLLAITVDRAGTADDARPLYISILHYSIHFESLTILRQSFSLVRMPALCERKPALAHVGVCAIEQR